MTITIFEWNGKYSVKFEIGLYEQVYKVKQDSVKGLDEVKRWIDKELCDEVMAHFLAMRGSFHQSITRNKTQE